MNELSPEQLAVVDEFISFLSSLENDDLRLSAMLRLRGLVCPYCGDLNDPYNYCIRDD